MSKYTFTFKKDNIIVDFSTTDKDVVERQFQIWVSDADEYAKRPKQKKQAQPVQQPIEQPEQEAVIEEAQPADAELENKPEEEIAQVEEVAQEQQPEVVAETVEQNQQDSLPEAETAEVPAKNEEQQVDETITEAGAEPEVFDQASSLLKTINDIQNPVEAKAPEVVFENVLEKSIENPTFEPSRVKDQVFLNLINSKNTNDKFHYFIITAYYLSEFEKMERFSLKQINAKLMHNFAVIIDHSTLQEAINQNFVELVPDLTGTSEVGEYQLTHEGEEFFVKI